MHCGSDIRAGVLVVEKDHCCIRRKWNRRQRYANAKLEEVSDAEEWMAIHHHGGGFDWEEMDEAAGTHGGEPEAEPAGEEAEWIKHFDNRIF